MLTKRDKEILRFIEEYKGLSLNMAASIFFPGKYSYDRARRRLKKLYNDGLITRYTNKTTEEYIYCFEDHKEMSPHDLYIYTFYAELVKQGATIIKFKKERKWSTGKKSDGFFEFLYNGETYLICLEVDFTHMTSIKDKYIPLYETKELQNEYGEDGEDIFPQVVIMTNKDIDRIEKVVYPFRVDFIDFGLNNFVQKILL